MKQGGKLSSRAIEQSMQRAMSGSVPLSKQYSEVLRMRFLWKVAVAHDWWVQHNEQKEAAE